MQNDLHCKLTKMTYRWNIVDEIWSSTHQYNQTYKFTVAIIYYQSPLGSDHKLTSEAEIPPYNLSPLLVYLLGEPFKKKLQL